MENTGRQDWIDVAIIALRAGGVENVRVEAVARELGVTKGSFYWHFRDRADLLDSVLVAWEQETEWLIERACEAATPRARLIRYFSLVPETRKHFPPDVEILAWARRDRAVNTRVRAVEKRRISFFEQQLKLGGVNGKEAARRARIAFLASQGWIEQLSRNAHGGESFETFATHLFDFVLKPKTRKKATS
jgi:AcrR family transcriptional regulator